MLAGVHVRDAYEAHPTTIAAGTPIVHWFRHLTPTEQTTFPVVDDAYRLLGVITVAEFGQIIQHASALDGLLLAADIVRPSESVALTDSLLDAIRTMGVRGTGALPVVDQRTNRLVGLLSRRHILDVYERAVRRPEPKTPA